MKTKQKYNLEKIIKEYKNVYYQNSDITSKNFPLPEKVETENWKLIKMDKSFSSEEALDKIKSEGCRPANIYELLLWSKNNQEKSQWVTGFGSSFIDSDGYHGVPRVYRYSDGGWKFDLGHFEYDWSDVHCLLCFCDSTLTTRPLENSDTLSLEQAVKLCKNAGYRVLKTINQEIEL